MWTACAIAFLLVALAELGDKSQLLLLGFTVRYKPFHVILGTALAIIFLQLLAVLVGSAAGTVFPTEIIAFAAGGMFIVFGVHTWRTSGVESDENDNRAAARSSVRFGPVLTVAAVFLLAEFGDKTQLMTVSIAADPAAAFRALGSAASSIQVPEPSVWVSFGVWIGSSLGMLVADLLAIMIGSTIAAHLPERLIGQVSSVVFVLFGIVMLISVMVGG